MALQQFRWRNEGNIFTSLKDLTSSNAQFCDQNFCSSLRKLLCLFFCLVVFSILFMIITCYNPAKSLKGDTGLKESHQWYVFFMYFFFPIFSSFDYNMLHISSLAFLTSRILAINLTPIKFFSKKNTWLLVVSREKHI